jgi:hypothetical protein
MVGFCFFAKILATNGSGSMAIERKFTLVGVPAALCQLGRLSRKERVKMAITLLDGKKKLPEMRCFCILR